MHPEMFCSWLKNPIIDYSLKFQYAKIILLDETVISVHKISCNESMEIIIIQTINLIQVINSGLNMMRIILY